MGLTIKAEEPCDGEAHIQMALVVCPAHRLDMDVEDVMTDDGWHELLGYRQHEGFCCQPSRERSKLKFVPLS